MILLPYSLLLLFLVFFLIDTKKAILVAVMIRPVIDCFYEAKYAFAGIKPTEFLGFLLPTLVCAKILLSRNHSFTRSKFSFLWIVFIFVQLFGTVLIVTVGDDAMLGLNYYYRAFNGFIGFFIFQEFFKSRDEFRVLLLVHLAAGLVPLGMSVYQNILGGTIRSEATIGGLVRNIGFYHDAYTLRLYCFQTLAAGILYWSYFLSGIKFLTRSLLVVMGGIAGFTIYKIFSKAGYLVLLEWLMVWYTVQRKFVKIAAIALVMVCAAVVFQEKLVVLETLDTVYSKEVGAFHGKEKSDRLFQGRVGTWKVAMKEYSELPLYMQIVGDGSPHTGAHNDFLRALLGTGFVGLFLYLMLLGAIGWRVLLNCWRVPSPLNTMALMLMGMWLIDAMGLVPGAYPGYQIFVWGFVGLALRGVEGLSAPGEVTLEIAAETEPQSTLGRGELPC
ncbi:O-antigen ligase family protein [Geobacter pickeringii]|uniref:O-antigen ligase-related domain-containing protein n=1 Tax=Geobacter pickeringii TaxID=345632 RepID=A0A0B5BFD8_9BACT|nr:O-antigen ligase family protein [Geobacter pickeringii]AJE03250.1 hypothetical protein GPICK_07695 [Geobacter pickeringii]